MTGSVAFGKLAASNRTLNRFNRKGNKKVNVKILYVEADLFHEIKVGNVRTLKLSKHCDLVQGQVISIVRNLSQVTDDSNARRAQVTGVYPKRWGYVEVAFKLIGHRPLLRPSLN